MARINGTRHDDTLEGTYRDDVIRGLAGNDMIIASPGWDFIDGGRGSDTVDYSAVINDLSIVLKGGTKTEVHFDGTYMDTLVNVENLIGGGGDDYFVGDKASNTFHGNGGNDYFVASCGYDTFCGGEGYDTVDYTSVNTPLTIRFDDHGSATVKAGGKVYDHLVSIENIIGGTRNDIIIGGDANNYFRGNAGNDCLDGGAGGDVLDGGTGDDKLTGGGDADIFYFARGYGKDVVTDFDAHGKSHDLVQLGKDLCIDDFRNVLDLASQKGHDVIIDFGHGDKLVLENTDLDHLCKCHFDLL